MCLFIIGITGISNQKSRSDSKARSDAGRRGEQHQNASHYYPSSEHSVIRKRPAQIKRRGPRPGPCVSSKHLIM